MSSEREKILERARDALVAHSTGDRSGPSMDEVLDELAPRFDTPEARQEWSALKDEVLELAAPRIQEIQATAWGTCGNEGCDNAVDPKRKYCCPECMAEGYRQARAINVTEEEGAEMVRLYTVKMLSQEEVARRTGRSVTAVRAQLQMHGIEIRSSWETRRGGEAA